MNIFRTPSDSCLKIVWKRFLDFTVYIIYFVFSLYFIWVFLIGIFPTLRRVLGIEREGSNDGVRCLNRVSQFISAVWLCCWIFSEFFELAGSRQMSYIFWNWSLAGSIRNCFKKFWTLDTYKYFVVLLMKGLNVPHGYFQALKLIITFFNSMLMEKIFEIHWHFNAIFWGKTSEDIQSLSKVWSKLISKYLFVEMTSSTFVKNFRQTG